MHKALLKCREWVDFFTDLGVSVLSILFISQFIMAQTLVPSGSMIPTINIGDHMVITYLPLYFRDPVAGEVVIFRQGDINIVKRVIAVGGDTVELSDGFVYINGSQISEREYVRDFGATYPQSLLFPYTVPDEHYFVMGDNRLNSEDSRSFSAISRAQIMAIPLFKFRVNMF